nr:YolD-like family protein [Paenibacillus larvae]
MQYRRQVDTEKRENHKKQEKRVHELSEILSESFESSTVITVVTYGIYKNREYSGVIIKLDLREEKILLKCQESMQWLHFSSILHVY